MTVPSAPALVRILVVEDDDVDFLVVRRLLGAIPQLTFEVERAADFAAAVRAIRRGAHDLYLVDYYLGGHTAVDLLRELAASEPRGPVIVLTGVDARDVDMAAMDAGADDYLVKGQIGPRLLERSIRYALGRFRLVREMRALSLRDELTGLYNRRAFQTLADQQLRHAKRFGHGLSLLFADIDGLKAINDRHGHAEGDRAIAAVADRLRRTFRDSDVVARLGGDEFVVLIPDGAPSSVEAALARVRERLDEVNASGQLQAHLSVSFGLATVNEGPDASVDELVARADRQLYVEKRRRRAAGPTPRAPLLRRVGRRARSGRARLPRGRVP